MTLLRLYRFLVRCGVMKLEPAYTIVQRLGGVEAVMKATGASRTRVYGWMQPKPGGTGGLIPQRHHLALLDFASSIGAPLTADDFLPRRAQQDEAA